MVPMGGSMRRRTLLKLAGAAAVLGAPHAMPRRSSAQSLNLQPLQATDAMVLLVPGFMAQMYEAVSTFKLSRLVSEVRAELRKVPAIGDHLAAAMPAHHVPSLAPGTAISFHTQERK